MERTVYQFHDDIWNKLCKEVEQLYPFEDAKFEFGSWYSALHVLLLL